MNESGPVSEKCIVKKHLQCKGITEDEDTCGCRCHAAKRGTR